MLLYSWNINGLRAVLRKGFKDWVKKTDPDIFCLQEIKIQESQIDEEVKNMNGYYSYFSCAEKKGYSGVAVYSKIKALSVVKKIGVEKFDEEGRFLFLEFDNFCLFNTYFPHSQRELTRLDFKTEFNEAYLEFIKKARKKYRKPLILTGDFNVAHKEIDLANPKENRRNPGFTDEERKFMNKLLPTGFLDTFRFLHPDKIQYTWWTYRFLARERNIGWRIDYFLAEKSLAKKIKKAEIHDQTFGSDHCPVFLEIDL